MTRTGAFNATRYDHQQIIEWVPEGSRVLDLGCGDGRLLKQLQREKRVTGYGLELNADMISQCIDNDVNVIQTNLDKGLVHFDTQSFDVVILSLTLQAMKRPQTLLSEMVRVGKQAIVTFPNFGHWKNRLQLALGGAMPMSTAIPHYWYNTPNIHLCTIRDFEALCARLDFHIEHSIALDNQGQQSLAIKARPNLFGEIALYQFTKNT